MRKLSIIIIFLFTGLQVRAQDPVFSQIIWNDLQLNPAMTGTYHQDNRLFGIYRDQWRQAPVPFATAHFSYDRKLSLKDGDKHRLGLGGQFLYDRAGTAALSQLNLEGLFSYTYLFNATKQRVTLGLGAGIGNRSIDGTKLIFEEGGNGSGGEVFLNDNWMTPRLSAGINFYSALKEKGSVELGVAIFNPHQPEGTFVNTPSTQLARLNTYTRFTINVASQWKLQPGFVYSTQGGNQQALATLFARYQIKEVGLWFGPGYRVGDAVNGYVGLEIADMRVGFSYDQNVSDFRQATNGIGAFEVSLRYGWSKKKPEKEEIEFTPPIAEETEEEEEEVVVPELAELLEEEEEELEELYVVEEVAPVVPSLTKQTVSLYFDNNSPAGKQQSYAQLHTSYMSRQAEYEAVFGAEASAFFEKKLSAEYTLFKEVAASVHEVLKAGKGVKISFKGFASNLGSATYNARLSEARVESIKAYLLAYEGGVLAPYVSSGKLILESEALGSTQSAIKDTDDKQKAIYSPTASEDRKVEVSVEELP
jgi:type IX secretion system PorP/SprF family membrane protein